jgi:hypothetical protein
MVSSYIVLSLYLVFDSRRESDSEGWNPEVFDFRRKSNSEERSSEVFDTEGMDLEESKTPQDV